MSSRESVEKTSLDDEKKGTVAVHVALVTDEVDTGAQLVAGTAMDVDPEESLRIRRKIDRHIMPLMCILYWIQFMDKTTLGSAAILGIKTDTHLTTNEYNWYDCALNSRIARAIDSQTGLEPYSI